MRTLRFLHAHLERFRATFWLLLLVGTLDGAASFSVPILLAEFTKQPISAHLAREAIPLIAGALSASLACQWLLRRFGEALIGRLSNQVRIKLFLRIEQLGFDSLATYHSGYLTSLTNQVSGSVASIAATIVWLLGHLSVTLVLFFIFTARESLALALTNLAILIVFVGISLALSRRIAILADTLNRSSAVVMERFIDFLTNITTIKRLSLVRWAGSRLASDSKTNDQAIDSLQLFHANRWLLLHAIFYTSVLATLAFLLSNVEQGLISASIIVLFIGGFSRVQNHAERLSELLKSLLETDAYVERLESILSKQRLFGEETAPPLQELRCAAISFRYPGSAYHLTVPHFRARAGDRILITGQSGQGKSTFISILAHQRVPDSGECLWNGTRYGQFNESLAGMFALVSQDVELFNLSLRDNLSLHQQIEDARIVALLERLQLSDLLANLPQGLDTQIGEKGLRLSAGQKQRITIARALLLERPILLLDEPTSHLDLITERAVVSCINELTLHTTLIIVSHREVFKDLCSRHYHFHAHTLRDESGSD
jgi:ABC-type bacteriocin/lantibiotic exporter with double-glycine peptidase domain